MSEMIFRYLVMYSVVTSAIFLVFFLFSLLPSQRLMMWLGLGSSMSIIINVFITFMLSFDLIMGYTVLLVTFWVSGYIIMKKRKVKVRLITEEEYDYMKNRNLIHYSFKCLHETEQTVEDDQAVSIRFQPTIDYAKNYSMIGDLKKKPFTWFHRSVQDDGLETSEKSLFYNHAMQKQRTYKYVIPASKLDPKRMYIRVEDNTIAYLGNAKMEGKVYLRFPWIRKHNKEEFLAGFMAIFIMFYFQTNLLYLKILQTVQRPQFINEGDYQ